MVGGWNTLEMVLLVNAPSVSLPRSCPWPGMFTVTEDTPSAKESTASEAAMKNFIGTKLKLIQKVIRVF